MDSKSNKQTKNNNFLDEENHIEIKYRGPTSNMF